MSVKGKPWDLEKSASYLYGGKTTHNDVWANNQHKILNVGKSTAYREFYGVNKEDRMLGRRTPATVRADVN